MDAYVASLYLYLNNFPRGFVRFEQTSLPKIKTFLMKKGRKFGKRDSYISIA